MYSHYNLVTGLIWIYQDLDEEDKVPSDGETMPDVSAEFLEMKRRFTLVTEEEPIPLSDEDQMEHPILIETIPPPDGTLRLQMDSIWLSGINVSFILSLFFSFSLFYTLHFNGLSNIKNVTNQLKQKIVKQLHPTHRHKSNK